MAPQPLPAFGPQIDPLELVAQYVTSEQGPDGSLGSALFHHRAQPEVRRALLAYLIPEAAPGQRAAALAWIGRYQGRRSIQARQLLRAGLTDPAPQVRRAALDHLGEAMAGRPDATDLIEQEVLPLTRPEHEPDWRLRLAAWSALGAALRVDPLPRYSQSGGDPESRVAAGVRLLSQMWNAQAGGDMNLVGALAGHWEHLLAAPE